MIKMNEYYSWEDWPRTILAVIFMMTHQGMMSWKFSGDFAVHVFYSLNGWLIEGVLLKMTPDQLKWMEFIFYKIIFVYNFLGTQQLSEYLNSKSLNGAGNHFYSKNIEEQFYLITPLILVLFKNLSYKTYFVLLQYFPGITNGGFKPPYEVFHTSLKHITVRT